MKPARTHYPTRATLSPRDKVRADRDLAAKNAAMRVLNRLARAEHKMMVARSHGQAIAACTICGTPITDPRSIERGIGPECWAKRNEGNDG